MSFICLALAALTTAAQLKEACLNGEVGRTFDLTGTVALPCDSSYGSILVRDTTGAILLYGDGAHEPPAYAAGDRVTARGRLIRNDPGPAIPFVDTSVRKGRVAPPTPVAATAAEILSGAHDEDYVRLGGTVIDALYDDLDGRFTFFIIRQGGDFLYASLAERLPKEDLARYTGAEVSVAGAVLFAAPRRCLRRTISLRGPDALRITRPADLDPFAADDLFTGPRLDLVGGVGWMTRRRTSGRVIAVWRDRTMMLVRTPGGNLVRVELADGDSPACGDAVEVVGFPETDLFGFNLIRARWRAADDAGSLPEKQPEALALADLFLSDKGLPRISTTRYGQPVRVTGTVRALPPDDESAFRLSDGRFELSVDVGADRAVLDALGVGAKVEVCGVAVLDTLPWRPQTPFPHVRGLTLVMRSAADLTVLAPPPWWTTGRLIAVIGALILVLAGILVWNLVLRTLVERRGRELLRAQIDTLTSELKTGERTRLAVELHDSLAQNLTGVAMEIEAAIRSGGDGASPHLTIADKALKSCRTELRNALWDLRNQALEEPVMKDAIRRTLLPHVKGIDLSIDFDVPRARFTDNTAHDILCIIRELVINAIRHGGATSVRVSGAIADNRLAFTVTDNGRGFDPAACPGVTEGHFGLQGIRERLRGHSGSLEIDSAPARGTRVTITLTPSSPL